jgi:predicted AAA+ superfamily ATPase
VRSSKKKGFVDPSIAVAALALSPDVLLTDLQTFGFLFECLCIRDLKAYIAGAGGHVSYYRDRYGLEADCVLHCSDGRYGLIEFTLGSSGIDDGAAHLLELKRLISKANDEKRARLREPSFLMVLTGTEMGYRRKDGVYVVPIGCLRN